MAKKPATAYAEPAELQEKPKPTEAQIAFAKATLARYESGGCTAEERDYAKAVLDSCKE